MINVFDIFHNYKINLIITLIMLFLFLSKNLLHLMLNLDLVYMVTLHQINMMVFPLHHNVLNNNMLDINKSFNL